LVPNFWFTFGLQARIVNIFGHFAEIGRLLIQKIWSRCFQEKKKKVFSFVSENLLRQDWKTFFFKVDFKMCSEVRLDSAQTSV